MILCCCVRGSYFLQLIVSSVSADLEVHNKTQFRRQKYLLKSEVQVEFSRPKIAKWISFPKGGRAEAGQQPKVSFSNVQPFQLAKIVRLEKSVIMWKNSKNLNIHHVQITWYESGSFSKSRFVNFTQWPGIVKKLVNFQIDKKSVKITGKFWFVNWTKIFALWPGKIAIFQTKNLTDDKRQKRTKKST